MDCVRFCSPLAAHDCAFCLAADETHNHLFFECVYTSGIWTHSLSKCDVSNPLLSLQHFIPWAAANWKGKSLSVAIKKFALQAAVYAIWCERNNRKFRNESLPSAVVFKAIVESMQLCLLSWKIPPSPSNSYIIHEWRLPS
ncbi:uncharacterized protein LOC133736137 [Rosa rugosa]|uniref:uncharacterized protein LOC133736137 n=1 Tax=Rosa rugosa TaxID=74645 RepID=UPI002B402E37|nr:uncharacterized protein LOC133736137 [Rosa rugosa]